MMEFIQSLDVSQIFGLLVAFITTNGAAILATIFTFIKLKAGNMKNAESIAEVKAYYEAELLKVAKNNEELIESIKKDVIDAISNIRTETKADIENRSIKIAESIEKAKKAITLEDLLSQDK